MMRFCLALALCPSLLWAACMERSDGQRVLGKIIGDPYVALPFPYPLTCDTVIIREGDTVRAYPGARLYFGRPAGRQSMVLVQGTLILAGTARNPVYIAGSMQANSADIMVPNHESWGGLRVTGTGALRMRHVRAYGAPTLITSESEKVSLDSVYIEDAENMLGPNGKQWKLNTAGTHLFATSFSTSTEMSPAPKPFKPASVLAKRQKAKSSWKPWAIGLGIGALTVGAGTTMWLVLREEDPSPYPPWVTMPPSDE